MSNHYKKGINTKRIASFLALLSFTSYMPISCLPAFSADIAADTLPSLNSAVNGSVSTSGTQMDVSVTGSKGTVGQFDWNTFNVGSDATVNWVFSANSQTALNRVLASGGMSYIYGKLTSSSSTGCSSCVNTSKVILINPSGILFGNGSSVDLNSFTASTYDISGAKNLSDLTDEELSTYAGDGGTTGTLFDIAGYNKTVSFVANDNMVDGNGYITADASGTKLASIVVDGSTMYADKSLALIGNKIDISNSDLSTTYSSTPNTSNSTQTRSNIKLVTGDGVNFYYTSAGNIDNSVSTESAEKTSGEEYGITITDSTLRSGNVLLYNGVADNGSIDISNSTIYSKKLLGTDTTISGTEYTAQQTGTNGNISITSKGTVNISGSNIQTTNDDADGSDDIGYGNLTISGSEGVTITNTQLRTADSTVNTDSDNITAGNILISSSNGDINIVQDEETSASDIVSADGTYTTTGIVAAGDITISAAGDVTIDGYDKIQAVGYGATDDTTRTINIAAANATFKDTVLNAENLNVDADEIIDVTETSIVANNIKLYGTDTTIDDSLLQYKELSFYDEDDTKTNNVTIKNGTTFRDKDTSTLKISTNGDLTLDNATLKQQKYGSTSTSNQTAIELESTEGSVTIANGSNITTSAGSFTVSAAEGSITVEDSDVYATDGSVSLTAKDNIASSNSQLWANNGDMTLTSTEGKVTAVDSTIIAEGGDTVIDQALSMNIDSDFTNSTIGATNKLSLITDTDITGSTLAAGTGVINDYTDLISLNNDDTDTHFIFAGALLDAGNDISITDITSANKVDFVAGNDINLASTGNMTLTDVTTDAGNETNIEAEGDLITNGYEILGGVKTTLSGDTVSTADGTYIATNENKLAVNAEGDIDITVTGVTSSENGLEINADVNTSEGSDPLEGKDVTVVAADGTLAIAKIKADTLNITADTILKADTTISADTDNVSALTEAGVDLDDKGYIEVRTDGGFNLDATTDYNSNNSSIYTGGNYGTTTSSDTVATGDTYDVVTDTQTEVTTSSELISSETTVGDEISRTITSETASGDATVTTERTDNVTDENGATGYTITTTTTQVYDVTADVTYEATQTDTYENTQTTTTTTTTTTYQDYETTTTSRDSEHIATLNENETNGFVLVYGKTSTDTDTTAEVVGTSTSTDVSTVTLDNTVEETATTVTKTITYQDTRTTTNVTFCEYEDDVAPDVANTFDDDVSSWVRIPRHSEGTSDTATVQNDIADTSSTVVAAAARLEMADDDESDDDDLE